MRLTAMPARIPLLDHAGNVQMWCDEAKIRELMSRGGYVLLGTKRRVRAIRSAIGGEEWIERRNFRVRKPGMGSSHRRETARNPHGVWDIDFIPAHMQDLFLTVIRETSA